MNIQRTLRGVAVITAVCMFLIIQGGVLAQPEVEIEPAPAAQGMEQAIIGRDFEPETRYRLAILNEAGEEVYVTNVTTDIGGNFTFVVNSESTDPPGEYSLVITPVDGGEELASTSWMLLASSVATAEAATATAAEAVEPTVTSTEALETPEEAEPTATEVASSTLEAEGAGEPAVDADDTDDGLFDSEWIWAVGLLVIILILAAASVLVIRRSRHS